MYIDLVYYRTDYLGITIVDDIELTQLIKRAGEMVDSLTGYEVNINGLETYPQFVQDQFKKAVASQVEFLKTFGVTSSAFTSEPSNVAIGKFNYANGQKTNARYSTNLLDYLLPTGLMGGAVKVVDNRGGYLC